MSRHRIVFLLPGPGHIPVGGFKVVYEYAQGLAARGHETHVVHAASIDDRGPRRAKAYAGYLRRRVTGWKPTPWFTFRAPVALHWIPELRLDALPEADVFVATAWQTAAWLGQQAPRGREHRLYLIQHDETWAGPEAAVRRTWTLPLEKIVIAPWLEDIARSYGEHAVVIPNGLDFEAFGLDVPIEGRDPHRVLSLFHEQKWKGTEIAIEAAERVRRDVPDLSLTFFGVFPPPRNLPAFCDYRRDPPQGDLRRLYNRAAVVLSGSLGEGFGLIGCETMMCGAAFVATDVGGHRAYCADGDTALLAPPGDAEALAHLLRRALTDVDYRIEIATRGYAHIQRFTWERAIDRFEGVLG